MGGGDLNMKKHFHPLTMENLERVWKAEEKKRKEEERIAQLQKELKEERQRESFQRQAVQSGLQKKKTEKLDWMYSHQKQVNTDEYLLGRKIDKHVEVLQEEDNHLLNAKSQVSASSNSIPKAGDILAKVKEDPLFLIKKKEEENRKLLVQNPIKMRKMKALLQKQMSEPKDKSKKKKRRRSSQSPEPIKDSHRIKSSFKQERDKYRRTERSPKNGRHDYRRHEISHKSERDWSSGGRYKQKDDRSDRRSKRRKRSASSAGESDDGDEMEAKRREMIENAKWRKVQRAENTKTYREERKREEESVNKNLKYSTDTDEKAQFIRAIQADSYSSEKMGSIEDRIHRTIHSKQRTNAALQKKFTSK